MIFGGLVVPFWLNFVVFYEIFASNVKNAIL